MRFKIQQALYRTERQLSVALNIPFCASSPEICRNRCVGKRPMEDSAKALHVEFVDLLRKQVEALELEAYVGLTDEERSEYYERQERIRDLETQMSQPSDRAA